MMEDQPAPPSMLGVVVAIAVGTGIVAAAIVFGRGQVSTQPQADSDQTVAGIGQVAGQSIGDVVVTVSDDDPVLGLPEAPITMVEFSDFACPFCKTYHQEVFPDLKRNYIETGKVRYVFKHFPLSQIHTQADLAAIAAQCAQDQDMFWPYADVLYSNQSALAQADVVRYAEELGLDLAAFTACLNAGQPPAVSDDQHLGIAIGVTGTPAFVVNDRLIEGALPYEVLAATLDRMLMQGQGESAQEDGHD